MPPIIIAFFILIGATTGPPLVRGLVTPKDPSARPKWGAPAPQEYHTWTSRPWIAVADGDSRACDVTFFALATRNRVTRLVAGGVEQELDSSWSFARTLKAGERRTIAFDFLDPIGGERLACQEQTLSCYAQTYGAPDSEVREGRCRADAEAPATKGGRPKLIGQTRPFTMSDPGLGGAYVDVAFEITGTLTDDWYCPAIEVEWPDQTRTRRESDCPPFAEHDRDQRFRWTFNHGFPGGTWKVRACLYKSGAVLACQDVTVRVLGDGSGTPFMGDQPNR